MTANQPLDVSIVGGGVSGLSAGLFCARAGMDTCVFEFGGSILKRNAHLENFPGFPGGVNARLLLEMMEEQAREAGCEIVREKVVRLLKARGSFSLETDGGRYGSDRVIVCSWSSVDFLDELDVTLVRDGSKTFVETDEGGRTSVDRLYAAGRVAQQYHQAIVSAGHGARVAITLLEDSDRPFYRDWVAPEGYFTRRGREVPPGCEEISREERLRRSEEGRQTMLDFLAEPRARPPQQHPRVEEE